ncbi:hypothetical protein INR49_010393 [Caranx melampygus]|nr:hypothetical protein INR49_010393 [Caranx melampygus]
MVLAKVRALAIYFDSLNESNLPVFSGGELVSGRVVVEVTGDVRVKSLDIAARGVAKVRWTESRNTGANTAYTQNYTEEGPALCVSDEDGPEEGLTVLHAGVHEFAFSFNLPQISMRLNQDLSSHSAPTSHNHRAATLPDALSPPAPPPPIRALATSFEGKHGSVRYWVKAELHRPWLRPVKTKKEFIVFEHIDINTPLLLLTADVMMRSGSSGRDQGENSVLLVCASGPISLSAKIERKGYTPGESIQIFAEVENCSSRVVVPKAALYQTQTFFAKGKGKQIQQLVSNLRGDPLPQGKSQSWEGKQLKIPPVSPSILDCPIIRVEYALVVYVDVPGGLNLSVSLPLVIGTIPLHAASTRTSSFSSTCSGLSWLGLSQRPEAPPSYNELEISESHRRSCLQGCDRSEQEELLTYITEFRYLPPPLYSEVDPYPTLWRGPGPRTSGDPTCVRPAEEAPVQRLSSGAPGPQQIKCQCR